MRPALTSSLRARLKNVIAIQRTQVDCRGGRVRPKHGKPCLVTLTLTLTLTQSKSSFFSL